MPTYVVLGSYTDQGIRKIKQHATLRQAAEQWVTAHDGRVIADLLTLGQHDFVFVCELPSDEAVLEAAFIFGSQGDVRTQTLRAFPAEQAEEIARRLP